MRFLFDTNAVIALLKGEAGFLRRLRRYEPGDFGLSSIVLRELYYGAHKSQRVGPNLARIEALRFEVVAFEAEDARRAGELRARLAAAGTPIGPYDVLIASQALARDFTLVTRNFGEFARVAGLKVEAWEAGG